LSRSVAKFGPPPSRTGASRDRPRRPCLYRRAAVRYRALVVFGSVRAMRVLDVTVDLGPGATPALIETMVKAVRVATDVGTDAVVRQVRRAATEQMKFPTDAELLRLSRGQANEGTDLSFRARQLFEERRDLDDRMRGMPPDLWFDYWYRVRRDSGKSHDPSAARRFERSLAGTPFPWLGSAASGLDMIDPDLYHALVADHVARFAPTEVTVRELRYQNPIVETVTAIGTGAEAISKTAGIIETLGTLGSRKRVAEAQAVIAEAQAKVATETADDHIETTRLDVELKREQLRQLRLSNDREEAENEALRIVNARTRGALSAEQAQRVVVEQLTASGQLDEADAVSSLEPADASALLELSGRAPKVEIWEEPDPDSA
jgi:hypothetical protein